MPAFPGSPYSTLNSVNALAHNCLPCFGKNARRDLVLDSDGTSQAVSSHAPHREPRRRPHPCPQKLCKRSRCLELRCVVSVIEKGFSAVVYCSNNRGLSFLCYAHNGSVQYTQALDKRTRTSRQAVTSADVLEHVSTEAPRLASSSTIALPMPCTEATVSKRLMDQPLTPPTNSRGASSQPRPITPDSPHDALGAVKGRRPLMPTYSQ